MTAHEIRQMALALPPDERIRLAGELLSSLPADESAFQIESLTDDELLAELDRRYNDRDGAESWENVIRKANPA